MELQKNLNSGAVQKNILIGVIVILVVAMVCLFSLLNIQFNSKIVQIENAASLNTRRLAEISNFLAQIDQQIKKQASQEKMMDVMSKMSVRPNGEE